MISLWLLASTALTAEDATYAEFILEASRGYGVSRNLICAVIEI